MSSETATTPSFPTARTFFTALYSAIDSPVSRQGSTDNSPIPPSLTTALRPHLLTLHALFPTLLLPALDLLDRGLITRLILNPRNQGTNDAGQNIQSEIPQHEPAGPNRVVHQGCRIVYYVKSAAQASRSSRYSRRADVGEVHCEVRTLAWNCSCAAFAFAAFNSSTIFTPAYETDDQCYNFEQVNTGEDNEMIDAALGEDETRDNTERWRWGGSMRDEEEIPLCKHLLACVFSERWVVADGMVEEREVGRSEMAGWAAGWGG